MDDEAQCIDDLTVDHDIQLHHLRGLVALELIIVGCIALRTGLDRIEEIIDDFVQRHLVLQNRTVRLDVLRTLIYATAILAELHDGTHEFRGHHNLHIDHWLFDMIDLGRIRKVRRVRQLHHRAVGLIYMVDNGWCRRHQVEVILSLQTLLYDIEVQKAEEAAAETEAEGLGGLRLILKRCIVQLQLFKGIPEIRILHRIGRIDTTVYHRLHLLIARQRLGRRIPIIGHGITDTGITDILDGGRDVANHTGTQLQTRNEAARSEIADLGDIEGGAARHQTDPGADLHGALLDPAENDNTTVVIIERIEDQGLQWRVLRAGRCRQLLHDGLQDRLYIFTGLRRDTWRIMGLDTDDVLDFLRHTIRIRRRKVDLIDDRKDFQIVIQRQIGICQRLCLDSLRRIDDEDRTIAGCKRTGYLVVKVHMARGIDEVKDILLPILCLIDDTGRLGLDRDATLTLDVHVIEHL